MKEVRSSLAGRGRKFAGIRKINIYDYEMLRQGVGSRNGRVCVCQCVLMTERQVQHTYKEIT